MCFQEHYRWVLPPFRRPPSHHLPLPPLKTFHSAAPPLSASTRSGPQPGATTRRRTSGDSFLMGRWRWRLRTWCRTTQGTSAHSPVSYGVMWCVVCGGTMWFVWRVLVCSVVMMRDCVACFGEFCGLTRLIVRYCKVC